MTDHPQVSVVIATHNRSELISRALDSVLAQTYKNFEIIVIDDASTDDTVEVLRKYQASHTNIAVRSLEQNVGPGAARNLGMRLAHGKYVAVMDDDICVPTRLEQQLELLDKHPDVDLCFGLVQWVDGDQNPLRIFPGILRRDEFPTEPNQIFTLLLLESNKIPNVTIMAKRETLLRYPYAEDVNIGEDWEMVLSMAADGVAMRGIPAVLVLVDRSTDRSSLMQNRPSAFQQQRRVLAKAHRSYRIPYPIMCHAFSNQLTREARYWSRIRGVSLVILALLLWPGSDFARRTLNEIMQRAWHKLPIRMEH